MAYANNPFDNQDPNQQNQNQNPNQNNPGGGGGSSVVAGGGGGQPAGTAGVGAGGQQRWTNIQSYLGANQPSQEVANKYKSTEESKINSATPQNAEQTLGQAMQGGSPDYEGYRNSQKAYSGPTQFSQNASYQNALQNVYQNAAGGQALNAGQSALQNQLDQDNPYLAQARTDLGTEATAKQASDQAALAANSQYLNDINTSYTNNYGASPHLYADQQNVANNWNAVNQMLGNGKGPVTATLARPTQGSNQIASSVMAPAHSQELNNIFSSSAFSGPGATIQDKIKMAQDMVSGKYGTPGQIDAAKAALAQYNALVAKYGK